MSLQRTADKFGATVSLICAVHCAFAPILLTVAPLLGLGFVFEDSFEAILILVTCGIATISLSWGFYKKHKEFLPLGVFLLGLMMLIIAQTVRDFSPLQEPILMSLGGLSIAVSHLINAKLCKSCHTCEHDN